MARYRKKPVEVEAFKYNENKEDHTLSMPQWFIGAVRNGTVFSNDDGLFIKTLEGVHHVSDGDMVIQGVKGEIYPCKPDIFALTYDLVEE